MIIGIGSDHVGFSYKAEIIQYINAKYSYGVIDFGTNNTERTDYPIYGEAVANAVVSGQADRGIVICGTGAGIGIAANKVNGIRCCICSDPYTAKLSRQHNNSNMIALGARVIGIELAKMIIDEWLGASYEGGRHQRRIDLISNIEQRQPRG